VKELNFDQYCNVQVRGILLQVCWGQEANQCTECELVHRSCASVCSAVDYCYICHGFDAQEIEEESPAAPQAEGIRAWSAIEWKLVRGDTNCGIERGNIETHQQWLMIIYEVKILKNSYHICPH
jgi:hypothetical protein